jgi:3D-(3,5/4)-trihydroxycyclohexane-1,2-dione acylhydrolase (decyclizing)
MLGLKLTLVVLDNRGYGCINRLQRATGGESFNNLLQDTKHETLPAIDFAGHARSLGAESVRVSGIAALEEALVQARSATRTFVVVIDTDPMAISDAGGAWWDVAIPEVSVRSDVQKARNHYEQARANQRIAD